MNDRADDERAQLLAVVRQCEECGAAVLVRWREDGEYEPVRHEDHTMSISTRRPSPDVPA
jgi:hypothetical protein